MIPTFPGFDYAIIHACNQLRDYGAEVDPGRWQGVPTEGKPDLMTLELQDLAFRVHLPRILYPEPCLELQEDIKPNLPWADNHFEERVSRVPSNPGEQYKNWPWWRGQDEQAMETFHMGPGKTEPQVSQVYERKFTHTYQERFWPRYAGEGDQGPYRTYEGRDNWGIRYEYGDLDDVVQLLLRDPYTRQAYLPIFFPEDTGAVHGGRIPCTLGYYFLLRNGQLHMKYTIRSCDVVRHFRDDIYLACRLLLWVLDELKTKELYKEHNERRFEPALTYGEWSTVEPGILTFHAYSFHVHKGDLHLL